MNTINNNLVVGDLIKEGEEIILLQSLEGLDAEYKYKIVIPVIGSKTTLPENSVIFSIYNEILEAEGISFDSFEGMNKTFMLNGDYRCLLKKPENLQFEIVDIENYIQDVIDYGNGHDLHIEKSILTKMQTDKLEPVNEVKNKQIYKALVVKFDLQKSCYATMLMREILKKTSEMQHQQDLSSVIDTYLRDSKQEAPIRLNNFRSS